jgi:phospholipase D1/2
MSSFFNKLQGSVDKLSADFKSKLGSGIEHSHTHDSGECTEGAHANQTDNRYVSFAPVRQAGNDVKWYVDGCSYMWAVSVALEQAKESIWILDCEYRSFLYSRFPSRSGAVVNKSITFASRNASYQDIFC